MTYPPFQILSAYPKPEEWDDWVEYESTAWPRKVEKHYMLVPTACFNCESACGLLAYVDKETHEIRRFEGNPAHPASRGRNCAKGPATINQIHDPERILYPMKRKGARGSGEWERTTWDAVLDDVAGRIRQAIVEKRGQEVMYHVGRPGADGYMDRVLQSWGIDGHNSHTNVCSAAARLGYNLWQGYDRPSPDHARARFILLLSAHLETGHYFNPHAQRIIEAKMHGAKIACIDVRLSNTASQSDYWISPWPGSESALLLAVARELLNSDRVDHEFMRRWVNWREYLRAVGVEEVYENFVAELKRTYAEYTPEFAAQECRIGPEIVATLANEIAAAGTAFASHVWRNTAAGNLGGWQVARALEFLHVLTGSVGTAGGLLPNGWNKFVPAPFLKPSPQKMWNELLWPKEYPLAFHEMSFLLPHMMKEGRAKLAVYFTRVYNPVWTNPDGGTWMDVLQDESKVGLHCALTPTWSETAMFAAYVLPMGMASERHDIQSQETHAGRWIAFRQPVLRVVQEKLGKKVDFTYESNPGEVWEEDEFWIELSWRIDPDGSLGIRKYYESPYRPGQKLTIGRILSLDFRKQCAGIAGARRARKSHAARIHAQIRCVPGSRRDDDAAYARAHRRRSAERRARRRWRIASRWTRGRCRDRWQECRGIPDALAASRVLFLHDERLEVGRADTAGIHPQPRAFLEHRPRQERIRAAADFPLAHADSHAFGQREVFERNFSPQSGLDASGGRDSSRRFERRTAARLNRNWILRESRVDHRGHEARHRGVLAPLGTLDTAS